MSRSTDGRKKHALPEPALVNSTMAAGMLGISVRHFLALEKIGAIGIMPIKLGSRVLWSCESLRAWARGGCLPRLECLKRQELAAGLEVK